MKKYTKVYFDYFSFDLCDFIPCEICGAQSNDIHHIHARSQRKDLENDIINIMAVCRMCHVEYGDKKQFIEHLQTIHANYIEKFAKDKS